MSIEVLRQAMNRIEVLRQAKVAADSIATEETTILGVLRAHDTVKWAHVRAIQAAGGQAEAYGVLTTSTAAEQAQVGITPAQIAIILQMIATLMANKPAPAPTPSSAPAITEATG